MNIKKIYNFVILFIFAVALSGCVVKDGKIVLNKKKPFKHNTPLIKTDIKKKGQAEIAKTIELGPKPFSGDTTKLKKRKKISSEFKRNYLVISNEFPSLKQTITLRYKNMEYKEAMQLMGKIGEINILVGDDVVGTVSAELVNVPWDKAFQALLDMKNYAADIDTAGNLIRVDLPSVLTQQESYKTAKAESAKKKFEVENSTDPIYSEIFRLYYITPAEAKKTITALFNSSENKNAIQITEEKTTRSIIVRGKDKDLDVVNKVLKEIDIKIQQVLIEAFIVEASSEFEKKLGTALGVRYDNLNSNTAGGSLGSGTISSFGVASATSGINLIRKTSSTVISAQISALEKLGLVRQISNPKIFTLNNQAANVVQGKNIPYEKGGTEGGIEFVKADLKLTVTPSIVGDGNVLLDIDVTNNTQGIPVAGKIPINTMEIKTKLLVADGDVVVIGGIKREVDTNIKNQTPGLGNVPVIGNLFKGKEQKDTLNELLVFIAPRIL